MSGRAAAGVLLALCVSSWPCAGADAGLVRETIERGLRGTDGEAAAVVVLVRHAEKRTDEEDPRLTRRGRRRAERLGRLLGDLGVERLIASEFRRAQHTLAPLERLTGRFVEIRPARMTDELADELRRTAPGELVVVAGHSNTVPDIARAIGTAPAASEMSEDVYDRVLVIVLPRPGDGRPAVLHELTFDP